MEDGVKCHEGKENFPDYPFHDWASIIPVRRCSPLFAVVRRLGIFPSSPLFAVVRRANVAESLCIPALRLDEYSTAGVAVE